eukprot:1994997-Amphidinium_carterae.1
MQNEKTRNGVYCLRGLGGLGLRSETLRVLRSGSTQGQSLPSLTSRTRSRRATTQRACSWPGPDI